MLVIVTIVMRWFFGRRLRRGMLMGIVVMRGTIVGLMSTLFCSRVPESCIVVTGTALLVAVVTVPRRVCQERFVAGSIEPRQTRHERHDRP